MLYRAHAGWLTGRLQSRCGDPELADTAIQDTFVTVWRSAARYRGDGDVGAWLWGIAIRRLIDLLRKSRTVPFDPDLLAFTEPVRATSAGPSGTPEDHVVGDGTRGDIHAALGLLAPELRAVLVATAIDGLTTKEAAQLLGVPQGTVKTRLMRARHDVRTILAQEPLT
jgi:RNA polymerase sigma-70 factor (ECF subfamily)